MYENSLSNGKREENDNSNADSRSSDVDDFEDECETEDADELAALNSQLDSLHSVLDGLEQQNNKIQNEFEALRKEIKKSKNVNNATNAETSLDNNNVCESKDGEDMSTDTLATL